MILSLYKTPYIYICMYEYILIHIIYFKTFKFLLLTITCDFKNNYPDYFTLPSLF